ncbi:MAG: type IV pilus biogenesis/stability protein PilW [Methylomarinum sp.]|nr:type IV pilus biogenesis/stability protein PilW [Methylomarinum sp.]
MLYKTLAKWLFISSIALFVTACVITQSNRDSMSKQEQANLYLQMGVRYLEMDMLKIAKGHLENAEDIDSGNASVQNILGVLHERLNESEEAAYHYQNAMRLDSDDASIKNNYGRFLCEQGDYKEGLELLKQALVMPLNNKKWFAYTNMGLCEAKYGEQAQAEYNFRQALRVNKNYAPSLFEMQKISYRAGKYMSARAFLERYLAVSKHNAQTLWYAVQTERALGNKQLTEEYRAKLFSLFPGSKEAQQLNTAVK